MLNKFSFISPIPRRYLQCLDSGKISLYFDCVHATFQVMLVHFRRSLFRSYAHLAVRGSVGVFSVQRRQFSKVLSLIANITIPSPLPSHSKFGFHQMFSRNGTFYSGRAANSKLLLFEPAKGASRQPPWFVRVILAREPCSYLA